jgi:alpha-2-macroglobulin
MSRLARRVVGLALASVCLLATPILPPLQAQTATFTHPIVVKDAERVDLLLKVQPKGRQTAVELRRTATKQLDEAKDARAAVQSLLAALAHDPKHAGTWANLARAYLAITPDPAKGERFELPALASGAAWRAHQLASDPREKAAALVTLSDALKSRSLWRPAIDALAASLALADDAGAREALAKLRAEHGFRMVDYKIDADTAEPRLCFNFSERLVGGQADVAKFVSVDGRDPQNVTAEGKQLCVDGLVHGKRYEFQVRAGLPSDTGESLAKVVEIAAYVRDRNPAVRLSGRAYVLPNRGQQGIPVVTVNTGKVAIEMFRIGDRGLIGATQGEGFLKQLESYDIENVRERTGQRIWQGELDVAERPNEDVTTAIPVAEAIPKLEAGVYIVSASVAAKPSSENTTNRASQWFIVSDLGLTALTGDDGLHAFVRSLAQAGPVAGVGVRLVARNNEVLATAKTDAAGYARFDAGTARGQGGLAPALLVAETGQDYAFLDLASGAFDLSDRGVNGREAPRALDAYLFAERGVYRPGEPVHLTGLVRDRAGLAATLPVTLVIARPDGVEHRRIVLPDQGLGGRTTTLALAPTVMTGTWRARLYADPKAEPLAQAAFLVEDFVPERLDLKLEAVTPTIGVDETGRIRVAGRWLYGPPAAGLDLEGEIIVKPATSEPAGLAGYRFGLADERITAVRRPLEDLADTDAEGRAEIAFRLPAIARTQRSLVADVLVRLKEPGGRSIERTLSLPVSPGSPRIGVKPLFADSVGQGEKAEFDLLLVAPDGKPLEATGLKWELVRLEQRWQWYTRDGQSNHEAVTSTRRIATGTVDSADGKPARVSVATDWGRYRLEVTSGQAGGARTTVVFNAGWSNGDSNDSPETLEVALDKPSYKAGETARLKITSREAGRAHIAVLGSGLLASRQVDVPAGGAEITLPVDGAWLPGAYVTATLYRALDESARRMPSRAIGVRWLGVDTSARTLGIKLEAPVQAKPAASLAVPMTIGGLTAGEEARVTVAAVDLGILNLTRYEAPAPEKWFYAQRRLGLEMRDLYGRLIDGMRADRGRLRSGGDGGGGLSLKGSPPVDQPLSLFSGIVTVGADGRARVAFDLPDFNGTVRLMAVAWSAGKVGSASADVVVRDALTLTATAPRFLTLGDKARLALDVHNVEAAAGSYRVSIAEESAAGLSKSLAQRDVALKTGERRTEHVDIAATTLGRTIYDVRVAGPGNLEVKRRIAVDVKAPGGDIKRVVSANLAPKGGKLTLSADLVADFVAGSARLSLLAGPVARFDAASLITQLDRYPYGCAEQTTSRALPLLYVNQMATRLGLVAETQIRERVEKAIERVFEMQDSSGAFGVWGPGDGDLWLSAYVSDFLTRAKEAGFTVRPQAFGQALDRLQNYLGYGQDFTKGGEARAYALYVLARNGRAQAGDLRYWVDTRLDRFATPLAQAQLGAALALMGDKERAERAFRAAIATIEKAASDAGAWNGARADYGSLLRDGAGIAALASETGTAKAATPGLTGVLARVYQTRTYTSTQEQAWMLLAARALAEETRDMSLTVGGRPLDATPVSQPVRVTLSGTIDATLARGSTPLDAVALATAPIDIVNHGDNATDVLVSVVGTSLTPEPAISKGFTIARAYYTLDGQKIDLQSAEGGASSLKQNDRLIVVLTVEGTEAGGRVLVVDRLPAGLEIENPRLVEGGDLKGFDWLQRPREPQHTEFRDDRFVAAFDFFGERSRGDGPAANVAAKATVAYIVRAVSPGTYVHPAATVEDMYRPDRFARTATGKLEVEAKR